ncbi:MAG: hypothetical protein ACKVU4_15575 [Phycisphaerales bacterium]
MRSAVKGRSVHAIGWCIVLDALGATQALAQCSPQWLAQHPGTALNGDAFAFTVFGGQLIAGGGFTTAGGQTMNRVARWTGDSWAPLGAGFNNYVWALTVHDGALYAGGLFQSSGAQFVGRVARWDGAGWKPVGTGFSSAVFSCVSTTTGLYVGTAGSGQTTPARVHRWDGSNWTTLGGGMTFPGGPPPIVYALAEFEGDLIAGGQFAYTGGQFTSLIARWNGTSCQAMGSGIGGIDPWVSELVVFQNELIAAGTSGIMRWNGTDWAPLGGVEYQHVYAMTIYRGDLIAGGWVPFTSGTSLTGVARWNGSTWSPLGFGTGPVVEALAACGDQLFCGGGIDTAGGLPVSFWARYGCQCQADCDSSGSLSIADFGCFQTQYVLAHPYADCNASGTLTVADFGCFQGKYVLGCP